MKRISDVTRRDITDGLVLEDINWSGRLDEVEFLSRVFDLTSLPSNDPRFDEMQGDVWQHRVNNCDGPDDWVYFDDRLDLLHCKDEIFLKFLTEMVHPIVRPDTIESGKLVRDFNGLLRRDGYELIEVKKISGRPVFAFRSIEEKPADYSEMDDTEDGLKRLWTAGYVRLFISHVSAHKATMAELKQCLLGYGISAFVAHEDIEPTREWLIEIEKALRTADIFLAYLTPDFHESKWTDHEVGFAICRRVPIIPIRVGIDPYGFLGKTQGLSGVFINCDVLAKKIFELLLKNEKCETRMLEAAITRFENSESFQQAKEGMLVLQGIEKFTNDMLNRIEQAVDKNTQLCGSYVVTSRLPHFLETRRLRLNANAENMLRRP